MNNLTKVWLVAVALVVILVAVGVFAGNRGTPPLGSVASPDIPFPYLNVNGVYRYFASSNNLYQASTTVCAIQAPAATSTLVSGGIQFTVSTDTATTLTAAKATTAFATTTVLATSSLAANAQGSFLVATTTPVGDSANGRAAITDRTFGSSTTRWLNWSLTGGTGTFSPTGSCHAVFEVF